MDKTITVTVASDNTLALTAFARAFAEMAGIDKLAPVTTDAAAVTEFPTITDVAPPAAPALPWDERIHASSRATNKDGSWTLRRKPKDLDESQWAARIAEVTAELEALMAIPVPSFTETVDNVAQSLCDANPRLFGHPPYSDANYTPEDIVAADPIAPPVIMPPLVLTEQTDIPQPPVIDLKASLAAVEVPLPPVTAPVAAVTDFPGLMKWLTTNVNPTNKHLVDQVLKAQGLTALPQLNQRPDLIPAFVAELGALL